MNRLLRGGLERMEMLLLQVGQFPDVMPFAGGEDDE